MIILWVIYAGDHLRVVRGTTELSSSGLYDHHMLLIQVRGERILIIHYTGDEQSNSAKIIEQEVEIDLKIDVLEILRYSETEEVFSADEAIKRARERAGEEEYGLFSNNCECFVNWALTGKNVSNQSNTGLLAAGAGAVAGAVQGWWKKDGSLTTALQGAADGMKKGYTFYRENRS